MRLDHGRSTAEGPNSIKIGFFQGNSVSKPGAKDIRFTRNKTNNVIYALALGWPTEPLVVQALGSAAATLPFNGGVEGFTLSLDFLAPARGAMSLKLTGPELACALRVP
jgi:alpha-L-fucosidase